MKINAFDTAPAASRQPPEGVSNRLGAARRRLLGRTALAVALAAAVGAGYQLGAQGVRGISDAHAVVPEAAPAALAPMPRVALPGFDRIVARYGPAVVNISTEGTVPTSMSGSPFGGLDPNDPFYEFFRRFGPQIEIPRGEQHVRGLGSGFIVSPDGVILTNAHVVDGADTVTVKLTDKREFKAKVIGVDKPTDVAVIKIDAKNLPTIPLGNPAESHVGDWVLAIGAPFGFENSVTAGIISAKSRSLPGDGYVPFLQTDVAINPGNSGGPLLNMAGEVIGINSQIYTRSGGYQGLSFAIPINVAAKVKDDILAHGKVSRGRIGVAVQDVDQALAESFGLDKPEGALVSSVERGGPADRAGLKPGDVILALNGDEVHGSGDLPPRIADIHPGSDAHLRIWRKGETHDITVKVGALTDGKSATVADNGAAPGKLGVAVRPLTSEERRQAGVAGGLVVLDASGAAARAGIQDGDIILALNGTPVASADGLRSLVAKAGKHVALLIQREDATIFVPIELG